MQAAPNVPLATVFRKENLLIGLPQEDRGSVVRALMQNLADTGRIPKKDFEDMLALVEARESMGSTAMGSGLAIPHGRAEVRKEVAAFALLKNGTVGWKPLDSGAVYGVFLMLTPASNDDRHRQLLRSVSAFAKVQTHMRALRGCLTAEDIHQVFSDYS